MTSFLSVVRCGRCDKDLDNDKSQVVCVNPKTGRSSHSRGWGIGGGQATPNSANLPKVF